MNYLVIEGYKDAAEKFAQESRLEPSVDLHSITDRMNIRTAIQMGNIDAAIEQVNDLDPESTCFSCVLHWIVWLPSCNCTIC